MIQAVQGAIQYTYKASPAQEDFSSALLNLSIVIEEVRGTFKNIGEKPGAGRVISERGMYPFESLKTIGKPVSKLGYREEITPRKAEETRCEIVDHWKKLRERLLREFDRPEPTYPESPYVKTN